MRNIFSNAEWNNIENEYHCLITEHSRKTSVEEQEVKYSWLDYSLLLVFIETNAMELNAKKKTS